MQQSRRKLSNIVVDRGALLRVSGPFLSMALLSIGVVFLIRYQVMQALQRTEIMGAENLGVMNALLELQRSVTTVGMVGLVVLAIVCLVLWLFYSHRVFGPLVAIRRHIEKLTEGDYSSRVQLRSADEFQNLAEDLNRLAEALEAKVKK